MLFLAPSIGSTLFIWLVVLPIELTAITIADVAVALRRSPFQPSPGLPRVARSEATTIDDYVSPVRLKIAPVCVGLGMVLCAATLVLWLSGAIEIGRFTGSPALPLLAAAVVAHVGGRVAEHRVLLSQQPAINSVELAWDDAFRADTFRALRLFQSSVTWLAVAAALVGIFAIVDGMNVTRWSVALGPTVLTFGYLAVMIFFVTRGAKDYFRWRLWPNIQDHWTAAEAEAEAEANTEANASGSISPAGRV